MHKGLLIVFAVFLVVGLFLKPITLALAEQSSSSDDRVTERGRMVSAQIESRGVSDPPVLQAMRKVLRHKFVPLESQDEAYADHPIPIGLGQTISQPYIVAYMTEALRLGADARVLEIGTGSGYQAAVLAEIVKEVYTIEIFPELGNAAKQRLKELGYANVEVKVADGYYGWEEHAPFDAIVVTCAADHVPPPLIKQLKESGVMCIPVGSPFFDQSLVLVKKQADGKVTTRNLLPVAFVPLLGGHKAATGKP